MSKIVLGPTCPCWCATSNFALRVVVTADKFKEAPMLFTGIQISKAALRCSSAHQDKVLVGALLNGDRQHLRREAVLRPPRQRPVVVVDGLLQVALQWGGDPRSGSHRCMQSTPKQGEQLKNLPTPYTFKIVLPSMWGKGNP